ncbi:MAG: hypothetical protein KAI67_05850 [Candidatus Pacebacteria bacterium]|nr:hypothetical protein [Candidatus Paceibacterota bacterium]
MSKQKKESLQAIVVKFFLVILLFTGMGTIIIGGVYIVGEHYKNGIDNKNSKIVENNQENENYYDLLEKKCAGDGCCLSSLRIIRENGYKEADENGKCLEEFRANGFRCEASLQWCEPIEKGSVETTEQELNIIGNYINGIMSMCAQNCDRYYIGSRSFELVDELENIDGVNRKEIVFATGKMVEVEELPTIAGPDSHERIYPDKVEAIKFKIDNYQKIDFPKISISEKELSNYLENKNAEFNFEFRNPLNEELKIKIKLDDFEGQNDFQYFILKPNETKIIQYIYERDDSLRDKREKDDVLDLVVMNDFVDDENYRKYYWDEANSLDSSGTMIYIDKSINLKDCRENDTSSWQTYRNEELGFEVKYPFEFSPQKVFQMEPDRMVFSVGNTTYNFSISIYSEKYVSEKKAVYTEEYCSRDGGYNDCMFWSTWLNEWNEDSEIFISKLNDNSCKKECDSVAHRFGCVDCETVLFDNKKAIKKIKYPLPNEDYFHWSLTIEKESSRIYLDLASNFHELAREEGVVSQEFSLQQLVSNQKDEEPKEIFDQILSSFKFID